MRKAGRVNDSDAGWVTRGREAVIGWGELEPDTRGGEAEDVERIAGRAGSGR